MKEITTDHWQLLLPEEWVAEQDEETIIITDADEVSVVEITTLLPENKNSVKSLIEELSEGTIKTAIAGLTAFYKEFEEDGMFWREWFCDGDNVVVILSHGSDLEHKHMDDGAVDEMLSTLALAVS